MDGAFDLAAVGGVAVAGLEVGSAVDGGDAAVGVLVHAGALDDISTHQAHLAVHGQALELGRRNLGKVLSVDPQLAGKGYLAGGGIVGFAVGVVGYVKVLGLVGGVVVWIEAKHLLPLLTKTAKRAYESFRQKPVPTIMMLKKATMISN